MTMKIGARVSTILFGDIHKGIITRLSAATTLGEPDSGEVVFDDGSHIWTGFGEFKVISYCSKEEMLTHCSFIVRCAAIRYEP